MKTLLFFLLFAPLASRAAGSDDGRFHIGYARTATYPDPDNYTSRSVRVSEQDQSFEIYYSSDPDLHIPATRLYLGTDLYVTIYNTSGPATVTHQTLDEPYTGLVHIKSNRPVLQELRLGHELEFFEGHDAVREKDALSINRLCEVYALKIAGYRLRLMLDAETRRPREMSVDDGKKKYNIIFTQYLVGDEVRMDWMRAPRKFVELGDISP